MTSRYSHNHGFTLVELLIVISIIGILAGLSISATMQAIKREQVNALTIGLAGWIEELRRSSLRGSPCGAVITTGNLSGTAVVAAGSEATVHNSCSSLNNPFRLPESAQSASFVITASPTSFSFTPRGSKFPSTDVLITIAMANNGPSRCIQLNGLLGNLEMGNASTGSCVLTKF
jgi:prepilin-type N-terminal cleavage/methylation domain-containing protein